MKYHSWQYLSIGLLCLTAVTLIGLQLKAAGWTVWSAGLLVTMAGERQFRWRMGSLYVALAVLGLTNISTDISWRNITLMGISMVSAVLLPWLITRVIFKDPIIQFSFHHGRGWYRQEIRYILLTAALAYVLIPVYYYSTGAHLNWSVGSDWSSLGRLFLGTNGMGIWDEFFFVTTVLAILRAYVPFGWANVAQAVLFTSFLYELGFTSWGWVIIFVFALTQGYIFKKTASMLYVITIHLTLDLILYLAIVHGHHPHLFNIFLTPVSQ